MQVRFLYYGSLRLTPRGIKRQKKRIREKVGKRLCKEKADKLKLPNPTEWVLTTQKHIDLIKEKKDEKTKAVKEKKEGDVIDFFKDIKVTPSPPAKYKGEWFEGS